MRSHGAAIVCALLFAAAAPATRAAELTYQGHVTAGQGGVPALFWNGTVVSPDGDHLYAWGEDDESRLVLFARDRSTGALDYVSKTQVGVDSPSLIEAIVPPDGRHVYVLTSEGLSIFSRNAGTGALTAAGSVAFGAGALAALAEPTALAISPDGAFVYVAAFSPGSVSVFARDAASGALAHVETELDDAGARHFEFTRHLLLGPGGEHVYAVGIAGVISLFTRDPVAGTLDFVGDTGTTLDSATVLATSPSDDAVFAAAALESTPGAFEFTHFLWDDASGELGFWADNAFEFYAADLVVDADGSHVFAAGSGIAILEPPNLDLELPLIEEGVGGVAGISAIVHAAMAPDGGHLYVTSNGAEQTIAIFATPRFDFLAADVDGAAAPGLGGASSVVVTPDGENVYVAGAIDAAIQLFERDPASGVLDPIGSVANGVGQIAGLLGVRALAVSPDGENVYAASVLDDSVVTFGRNAFGLLGFLDQEEDGVGASTQLDGATALAVSPDGKSVYVASIGDDSVSIFGRSPTNGSLSPGGFYVDGVGGVNGLASASSIAISPDGKHVYVGGYGDDGIAAFTRDPNLGSLDFLSFTGNNNLDGISGVAVSPDGAFVYATASLFDSLARYTRNPTTGALSGAFFWYHEPGVADGLAAPASLSFSPDGRLLFVASELQSTVAIYRRDLATGDVTLLQTETDGLRVEDVLGGVRSLAASPDGRNLYAAALSGAVVAFVPEPESSWLALAAAITLGCMRRREART